MFRLAHSSWCKPRFTASASTLFNRALARRCFSSSAPFDKILIANRGEIACRVMKTCKEMGIKSVAIYSEADRYSKHVAMADEAHCVGPAASAESYLRQDKILDVIKKTGAQAVHPGYGFLSENSDFSGLLEKNDVQFIGPKEYAIVSMGDKITSKQIASDAGVNTIPGFIGAVEKEDVTRICNEIGYPVMIKAAHGGGGKGMRVAWDDADALEGFQLSQAEALASFGNDTILIEKFIEEPRHIEIQVLADQHGNAIYLNERECSIQRRNQKVIEEAPSTFLDAETRKAMGEQSVALCKAVEYQSAGTVEFLVDKYRNFYFLEMNTRLQVEHPVTEYITKVDLVREMINVAAGKPLSYSQDDIGIHGWSFESRVYAEDPLNGFLPCIGRLSRYQEPTGENVRTDSGILEGSQISIWYDPMICKLVTYGQTRDEALETMRKALDSYVIRGVTHNINFLRALCDHPRFISGDITTKFIEEEYADGFHGVELVEKDKIQLVASAVAMHAEKLADQANITQQLESFNRELAFAKNVHHLFVTLPNGETSEVAVLDISYGFNTDFDDEMMDRDDSDDSDDFDDLDFSENIDDDWSDSEADATNLVLEINGQTVYVRSSRKDNESVYRLNIKVDGASESAPLTHQLLERSDGSNSYKIQHLGTEFEVDVDTPAERTAKAFMPEKEVLDTSRFMVCPMPGAVHSIDVQEGDEVYPGQIVCVVEAMKMQNALRATRATKVKKILAAPGDTLSKNDLLIEFETDDE